MKNYAITQPYINGLLSDDFLYFEGVHRPLEVYTLRDGGTYDTNTADILEKYLNDIYNLFLRKISLFVTDDYSTDEDTTKLQALLQELIKVKKLIHESAKDQK
jgi:hypothetical protein